MKTDKKFTNSLVNESSPYLLQHAHNPVNWHAWNSTTLEKAAAENKLLLISIGYSACHWCHVMEHESFENEEVADLMNAHFINVKVDREERPDIDQVYMHAVQLMTGRGGWPLNCIALPDGRPIYGGTYFNKDQWLNVLNQLSDFYKTQPLKCEEYAAELTNGVQKTESIINVTDDLDFNTEHLNSSYDIFKKQFDNYEGGPNRAPKFPMPCNYIFLLRHFFHTKDAHCLKHVLLTLRKLAYGGIYDQLGGGFARYSTDTKWKVPHFEKMLYDNAQLISLYSEAYHLTKEVLFKDVVYETIAFISRELTAPEGSFYSALDADSEGIEGKYYIWTKNELLEILNDDTTLFFDYYNVNETGYWEHDSYILLRSTSDDALAQQYNLSLAALKLKIKSLKDKLLQIREKRIRPGLDDKQLTSWNALMLKALVDAYLVFAEPSFLKMALENAAHIETKIIKSDGGLWHNYKAGKANINGFLEDYSFVIDAFLALYKATSDEGWLLKSKQLLSYCMNNFYDEKLSMFYFTSLKDDKLFSRKMEIQDNVIPSSNSAMAKNLFVIGHYFSDYEQINLSKQMLLNVKDDLLRFPSAYANWLQVLQYMVYNYYEVCFTGNDAANLFKEFSSSYNPNTLPCVSTGKSDLPLMQNRHTDKPLIYVCNDGSCLLPVTTTKAAFELIK
jgi:hypothetical protein